MEDNAELQPLEETIPRVGRGLVLFRSASAAASKNFILSFRLIVEEGSVRLVNMIVNLLENYCVRLLS